MSGVSESLILLTKNEQPWVIRSGRSEEMSDREQIAQVAHQQWVNEWTAHFFERIAHLLIFGQNTSDLLGNQMSEFPALHFFIHCLLHWTYMYSLYSKFWSCYMHCIVHLYTAMYSYPAVDKLYCISTVYCNVLLSCSGYTGTVKCIHLAMWYNPAVAILNFAYILQCDLIILMWLYWILHISCNVI